MEILTLILAWKISWTEETGGLKSKRQQKSDDWVTKHVAIATECVHLYISSVL